MDFAAHISDDLKRSLRPYQATPAGQLVRALQMGAAEWGYSGAVDLSDVGTGKSYMDTAAALSTGRRPIVLCPSVGVPGWEACLKHFNAEARHIGTYEAVRGNYRPHVGQFEGAYFRWKHPAESVLILDEAQIVKGHNSMTTAAVGGAIMQGIPIIAASATLATSPLEMRIAGRITGLHQGGADWKRWMQAAGCYYDEEAERWKWNHRHHAGILDDIHHTLIPWRGCRLRKADLGERPGTHIKTRAVDIPEAVQINKEWKEHQEKIAFMKANPDRFSREVIRATQYKGRMALWRRSEVALVPHVAPLVKACLAEGKAVVCFFNFNESRKLMGKLLNTKDGFYGGQTINQRQKIMAAFQANRIWVLLNNIGAGGASCSLHDLTGDRPRESFIFASDNPVKMGQAPGRIDRDGGKTESNQWIVHIQGGVMESIVKNVMRRMRQMETLNDGTGQRRFSQPQHHPQHDRPLAA